MCATIVVMESFKLVKDKTSKKLTRTVAILAFLSSLPFTFAWFIGYYLGWFLGSIGGPPPFIGALLLLVLGLGLHEVAVFIPTLLVAKITHTHGGQVWVVTHLVGGMLWLLILLSVIWDLISGNIR